MKTPRLILLILTFIGSALLVAEAQQQERRGERSAQMRRKLDHSGMILEGITMERFAGVARGAEGLRQAGEAAKWHVLPTDDYLRFASEYGRLLDRLEASAEAENLDAATLAYVQLTINCIDCHKYVRIPLREPPDAP